MPFFRKPSRLRPIALLLLMAVILPLLVGGGVAAPRPVEAAAPIILGLGWWAITGILAAITASGAAIVYGPTYVTGVVFTGIVSIIRLIIDAITGLVTSILGFLLAFLFEVATYNNFLHTSVVEIGWVAVRDVANLFFIFILLLIAFSTMFGSEKLHYKQHLVKLLLMAILVNFSKMITGIFIDFSQVVMLSFLQPMKDNGAGALGVLLNVPAQGQLWTEGIDGEANASSLLGNLIAAITDLLFSIVGVVVIGIMVAMLLVRIVYLWVLVILSPLAFLLSTFTQGQQYAGKWWQELGKNLTAGPVLAFFLWLALISNVGINILVPEGGGEDIKTTAQAENVIGVRYKNIPAVGTAKTGAATNVAKLLVTVAFLLLGLKTASETGAAGAGMAGAAAGFIQNRGKDILKAGERGIARGDLGKLVGGKRNFIGRAVGKYSRYLAPEVIKRGWAGRTEREERYAFPAAAGDFEDLLNRRLNPRGGTTGGAKLAAKLLGGIGLGETKAAKWLGSVKPGGEKTAEGRIARLRAAKERQKEIEEANYSAEEKAGGTYDAEGEIQIMGAALANIDGNHQDDLARIGYARGMGEEGSGGESGVYDPVMHLVFMRNKLEHATGDKDQAAQYGVSLSEYSEEQSKSRAELGFANTDEATGKAQWADTWKGTQDDEGNDLEDKELTGKVKVAGKDFDLSQEGEREKAMRTAQLKQLEKIEVEAQLPTGSLQVQLNRTLKNDERMNHLNGAEYMLISQQMVGNMDYRTKRGNPEKTVGNFGAAEFRRQLPKRAKNNRNSVYEELHGVGRLLWAQLAAQFAATIERTRQFQPRALDDIGIVHNQKYSDDTIAQDQVDPVMHGSSQVNFDRFAEAYDLNAGSTISWLSRSGHSKDQYQEIQRKGNTAYKKRQIVNAELDERFMPAVMKIQETKGEGEVVTQEEVNTLVAKIKAEITTELSGSSELSEKYKGKLKDMDVTAVIKKAEASKKSSSEEEGDAATGDAPAQPTPRGPKPRGGAPVATPPGSTTPSAAPVGATEPAAQASASGDQGANTEVAEGLRKLTSTLDGMGSAFASLATGLKDVKSGLATFTTDMKTGMGSLESAVSRGTIVQKRLNRKMKELIDKGASSTDTETKS